MSVSGKGGTAVMDMCCVAGQSLPVRLLIKAGIVVVVGDLDVSCGLAGCVGGLGFVVYASSVRDIMSWDVIWDAK
jgi:hypothetical protein